MTQRAGGLLLTRRLFVGGVLGAGLGYGLLSYYQGRQREKQRESLATSLSVGEKKAALEWRPPPRAHLIRRLKGQSEEGVPLPEEEACFDLLVIGGGATGSGCALDAAARGLRVACVERGDFSSGTSSKSTKLVHGGVRYLEKAFLHLDWDQFAMVREALAERSTVLRIAPHLTGQLPIMLPIYNWLMVPYYWLGAKAYDLVAGGKGLEGSYYLDQSKALRVFPMLRKESLCGAIVYYDGEQDDARMNVALALTAIQQGATMTNYTEVVQLIKEVPKGQDDRAAKVCGAWVRDRLTGEVFAVRSRGVVSATGPFCDLIRQMDDPTCPPIVLPSTGTHIIFPSYYSPRQMGLIDPNSSDGRVIFFLPWEDNTIAGTTDAPSPTITFEPKATQDEIGFIVREVKRYLDPVVEVRNSDVLAAWSGLRPLVRDPRAKSTSEIVRNHIILVSPSNLITIAGGKWTTYRKMAQETIDHAIHLFHLKPTPSSTERIPLIGAHGYYENMYIKLIQQFGLETDIARHLCKSYGDRAFIVAAMSQNTDNQRWPLYGKRLIPWYPYLEAEVRYAARFEYAQTAVDVLARRTRLAHLSCHAAHDALPRVLDILREELGWSEGEVKRQHQLACDYLKTCGIDDLHRMRANFARQQIDHYRKVYLDLLPAGAAVQWQRLPLSLALPALQRILREEEQEGQIQLEKVDWDEIISYIDPDHIGSIDFSNFLDALAQLKKRYLHNN